MLKIENNSKELKAFQDHVLEVYPQEACGVFCNNKYFPIENTHPDPANGFMFPENVSLDLASKKNPYLILHSHTMSSFNYDGRVPSKEDQQGQINTGKPWGIVHCDGENVSKILYFGFPSNDPLLDRPYFPKIYDCFTICRDYYYQKLSMVVRDFPRDSDWGKEQTDNPTILMDNYKGVGFREVLRRDSLRAHDIILFNIASNYPNHLGIFTGEDQDTFIHHLLDRKSGKDSIKRWARNIYKVLRYETSVI